jgi:peptidoglycan/xylan/chitin deacetylase (PgdA/CDA1 family)
VSLGRLLLFVLIALSFVMVALAFTWGAPPLWVPIGFAALYFGVIFWGVMDLRLSMFGDAICSVPEAESCVALTFDDGPDPVSTRLALRALREGKARATFFVVGKKAEKYPEILREIVAEGHELGVHSYAHERLYSLLPPERVKADIERTREIILSATGVCPVWFRPPVGQMSPRTAKGVERAGAVVIGWTVRALDGLRKTTEATCERRVLTGLKAGAIVLLHDGWEREEVEPAAGLLGCPTGVRSLPKILAACRKAGLSPVTVQELLASTAEGQER